MMSPASGYVILAANNSKNTWQTITVPAGHVAMMTFFNVSCYWSECTEFKVHLYVRKGITSDRDVFRGCSMRMKTTRVLKATSISMWCVHDNGDVDTCCSYLLLSFHPESKAPRKQSNGLYNCSVDYYWRFEQHVLCNVMVDCEDGRDESPNCPYSSPTCNGWIASGGKCFKLVTDNQLKDYASSAKDFFETIHEYCAALNASRGLIKTLQQLDTMASLIVDSSNYFYGLTWLGLLWGGLSTMRMYRYNVQADDNTVLHHFDRKIEMYSYLPNRKLGVTLNPLSRNDLYTVSYKTAGTNQYYMNIICQFTPNDHDNNDHKAKTGITLANVSLALTREKPRLTRCPGGQLTHTCLLCGSGTGYGPEPKAPPCSVGHVQDTRSTAGPWRPTQPVPLFLCDDGVTRLSYTLVCDFLPHCPDRSDELSCLHPLCQNTFPCTNGQCIPYSRRCDEKSDCLDDSDEQRCDIFLKDEYDHKSKLAAPVLINFDGLRFTMVKMHPNESCPDTHYRCPGENNDCLPVYTRCNGLYDCLDHEDEDGCENVTCPGFYRCLSSPVCVHVHHVCDGVAQCPQWDDEWLCELTCPHDCLCHGHLFLCSQPFFTHLFRHLRYLDAQGSGMALSEFRNNPYILHLSLSRCHLTVLHPVELLNLQFLDLSENDLHFINMTVFHKFKNLQTLSLAKNPLRSLHGSGVSTHQQTVLRTMDLSRTEFAVFNSEALSVFAKVRILNLSFSAVRTIHSHGFQFVPKLTKLYIENSPVNKFPNDLLKPLTSLQVVSASNYKFCCRQILPSHFREIICNAPRTDVSSCEDLLHSGTFRAFLWLVSVLSMSGNAVCFVVRVCVQRKLSTSGFQVFVSHLSLSDFLMGVYITIIGVADLLFRGKYLHYDDTWTHSVACKVAGFLSLLSCEVSALVICLITLDRFIVLRFPFSSVRFQRTTAIVACVVTWLTGGSLALVPLLPVTSHWEFFSQTGICLPLPITRHDFKGRLYSVIVLIVFNFFVFLLVAAGQLCIYWSVQKNALKADTTKVSRDFTLARRLLSVAATNFLCWFPIGLCGLLALAGVPIPGQVNVAFAIFALPLNSALNPSIYTFNMLAEKRQKWKEARLLKSLIETST